MTVRFVPQTVRAFDGGNPPADGVPAETLTDDQIRQMAAPANISTLLWNRASVAERRELLAGELVRLPGARPASAPPVLVASLGTVALPIVGAGGGTAAGLSGIAAALGRLGIFALPLMLGGDTPQPRRFDLGGGLLLSVSPDGQRAWFIQQETSWQFGPFSGVRERTLATPITIAGGELRFDADRLRAELGRELPQTLLEAALRPAGVPRDLQTSQSSLRTAMASAPDPCRNMPGQRHHIIPAELMVQHQAFLTRIGFRLDDPNNIIRLPSNDAQRANMDAMCNSLRPVHRGSHPNCSEAINQRLEQISNALNRGSLTEAQARAQVESLMAQVRAGLSSGGHQGINMRSVIDFIRNLRL